MLGPARDCRPGKALTAVLRVVALGVLVSSCRVTTGDFAAATKVVAVSNQNKPLVTIDAREKIRQVLSYLARGQEGWHVAEDPIPTPSVVLHFYGREGHLGEFSIGANFFMTYQNGVLYIKRVGDREKKEMAGLLGLTGLDF